MVSQAAVGSDIIFEQHSHCATCSRKELQNTVQPRLSPGLKTVHQLLSTSRSACKTQITSRSSDVIILSEEAYFQRSTAGSDCQNVNHHV